ncbi:hypothetical protein [Acuticoccus sediminis]|nr:hypothetical protein [Acuticoccus sediminis]
MSNITLPGIAPHGAAGSLAIRIVQNFEEAGRHDLPDKAVAIPRPGALDRRAIVPPTRRPGAMPQ